MSHPRCARLFFLHSELGQDAGARCSECPTGAQFPTYSAKCLVLLTCHQDDTGASGRRASFKLPGWLSSSRVGSCGSRFRQDTACEGMGAATARKGYGAG